MRKFAKSKYFKYDTDQDYCRMDYPLVKNKTNYVRKKNANFKPL